MKKAPVVAIFSHPDDEAFGPAGTLAKLVKEHDVYILCATSGEEGQNGHQGRSTKLVHEIRRQELRRSAKILGVKKVYFLGFRDGTLCNTNYHALAESITRHLKKLKPNTLLTFEPQGVSGHIDHITVAMVTQFVFHKLSFVKKIMFYALPYDEKREKKQDYFVYFPVGYKPEEIDMTVNIEDVWEQKLEAMKQHKTQIADMNRILAQYEKEDRSKEEHFIIKKK